MEEIKKCPFCGSDNIGIMTDIIWCKKCSGGVEAEKGEDVTKLWNTRATNNCYVIPKEAVSEEKIKQLLDYQLIRLQKKEECFTWTERITQALTTT